MALAHHEATHRDQQRRADAELFRAQQGRDDDIAPRFDSTIDAQAHLVSKAVDGQDLMHLRQADLPRQARILDRRLRRCTCPAAMP